MIGLSTGLACSLLIALYIADELSYDRFNTQAGRIYRIDEQVHFGDFNYNGAEVPAIMGPTFAKDFKEIEQYTRFKSSPGVVIRKGTENIREEAVVYADSSLFEVFTLPMIAGDKRTALKEPGCLVITERAAKKYFGGPDVMGKSLLIDGHANYKITGVIKDIPARSHFHFDLFLPLCELEQSRNNSWITYNDQTYLLWAMTGWLQDFAYRIPIGWWMFVAAGGMCLVIALATMSYQVIKAAVVDPVTSLRTE